MAAAMALPRREALGAETQAKLQEIAVENASLAPQYTFATTLKEQRKQLKTNPLMLRFAESRKELAADKHRPLYHFTSPENHGDPNGICYWKGYYHLFYQTKPPEDPRNHWGHAISKDFIHWEDLPFAIYPGPEFNCNSGTILIEGDRAIVMYGGGDGEMVAVSEDPLLLNWEKLTGKWVTDTGRGDPCLFKNDGVYYSITGGLGQYETAPGNRLMRTNHLMRSKNLTDWEYLHAFVENDDYSLVGDDGACPYFLPIGKNGKYLLLNHSHTSGSKYLIGDYDTGRNKFVVTNGGSFNQGPVGPSGIHAPSAFSDEKGGVYCIFNVNGSKYRPSWFRRKNQELPYYWTKGSVYHKSTLGRMGTSLMTMPVHLTVDDSDNLQISPTGEYESLRGKHERITDLTLPANKEILLDKIKGNVLEMKMTLDPQKSSMIEIDVLRSPDQQEYTRILFYKNRGYRDYSMEPGTLPVTSAICLDNSRSSLYPNVYARVPETAYVSFRKDELVELHIFIDRSIVEVFVNGRQFVAEGVYPSLDESVGISIRAQGQPALLKSLDAWQMNPIF